MVRKKKDEETAMAVYSVQTGNSYQYDGMDAHIRVADFRDFCTCDKGGYCEHYTVRQGPKK